MNQFVSMLKQYWEDRPFYWHDDPRQDEEIIPLPGNASVVVLAPHPDDPESVAITTHLLMRNGCDIRYVILTLSPSGVRDDYARNFSNGSHGSDLGLKKVIRQNEQIKSARLFGLTKDKLLFLGLDEPDKTDAFNTTTYQQDIDRILKSATPDIAIMPIGHDTNTTHKAVYESFRASAQHYVYQSGKSLVAFYNEDPKTIQIRKDLAVTFDEVRAEWKRELLRTHDSQQQRNLKTHHIGFDERILNVNRKGAQSLPASVLPNKGRPLYIEVFEIEIFNSAMRTL